MGCRGKAARRVPGGCRRESDDPEKAGDSTPHARSLSPRMVHASVTASAAQAPFRACLPYTLATTHSVQCEHTDTTETNWPGQDEQEAGSYQTKRKDKTHLPTQTCLPLCASSGQHSFSPGLATKQGNGTKDAADPSLLRGCSTRHTQHRRKGSAPN